MSKHTIITATIGDNDLGVWGTYSSTIANMVYNAEASTPDERRQHLLDHAAEADAQQEFWTDADQALVDIAYSDVVRIAPFDTYDRG